MNMNDNNVTAIVLVKNQDELLSKCLESLSWCEQILVIDDESVDKSNEIAKKHGAKIIRRKLNNDFSGQRNFGLDNVKTEWTLFIDADEIVREKLANEIKRSIKNEKYHGYRFKRSDWFIGKLLKYGDPGSFDEIRLAKTNSGKFHNKVHEVWEINGRVGKLENPIEHNPHKNIDDMISALNFYSTLRAQELFDNAKKSNWMTIIIYPLGKFIQNYFIRQGIRDGSHGFVNALLMSFYSYLVRSKLFLLNRE